MSLIPGTTETMNNVYVGQRYVPVAGGEWSPDKAYEALVYVYYDNKTYISNRPVPQGIDISNTLYWQIAFDIGGQLSQVNQDITNIENSVAALKTSDSNQNIKIKGLQDNEATQNTDIANLKTGQTNANNKITEIENQLEGLESNAGGAWVNAKDLGIMPGTDITAALKALPASTPNLALPAGNYTVSQAVTINFPLYFAPGAKIIGNAQNIVCTKPVTAGRYQICDGSYGFKIPNPVCYPEWFGWLPNLQESNDAINRMYNCADSMRILDLSGGTYYGSTTVSFKFNTRVIGKKTTTLHTCTFAGGVSALSIEHCFLLSCHIADTGSFTDLSFFDCDFNNNTDGFANNAAVSNSITFDKCVINFTAGSDVKAYYWFGFNNGGIPLSMKNCILYLTGTGITFFNCPNFHHNADFVNIKLSASSKLTAFANFTQGTCRCHFEQITGVINQPDLANCGANSQILIESSQYQSTQQFNNYCVLINSELTLTGDATTQYFLDYFTAIGCKITYSSTGTVVYALLNKGTFIECRFSGFSINPSGGTGFGSIVLIACEGFSNSDYPTDLTSQNFATLPERYNNLPIVLWYGTAATGMEPYDVAGTMVSSRGGTIHLKFTRNNVPQSIRALAYQQISPSLGTLSNLSYTGDSSDYSITLPNLAAGSQIVLRVQLNDFQHTNLMLNVVLF